MNSDAQPKNKRHHFVPRHYLRQFCIHGTEQVAAATVSPFNFIGAAAINRQCQEDNFYKDDGELDDILQQSERDIAPVLVRVANNCEFDSKELVALRLLTVILHLRTRRTLEAAKVLPKFIADQILNDSIDRGELPPPSDGRKEGLMDFSEMTGVAFKQAAIPNWLEMQTLDCKLLEASTRSFFLTSDNPVAILNQRLENAVPGRSYAGFSRYGFQLLLPISPTLCLFFYDPNAYKVGGRRHRHTNLINLSAQDVDIINSLQVQSAEYCVYFHDLKLEPEVRRLVSKYFRLRIPIEATLQVIRGTNQNETLANAKTLSVKLPRPWTFCSIRGCPVAGSDFRRNPEWTKMIEDLMHDMENNPGDGDIFVHLEKILGCKFSEVESPQD